MTNIISLARCEIVAMKPYASARGTAAADGVLLNANEAPAPHVASPEWERLELNRYPEPQPGALVKQLAELYSVDASNILVTRGSDEGIDLLARVFCQPGQDAVMQCSPCFGMYAIAATIQGAEIIDVPRLTDASFEIDYGSLVKAINTTENLKIVFLTSPNNPTGDLIASSQLESVLAACQDKALVVLDEAYIEYCQADSATKMVSKWQNLVVLRTLSKAWAAAGLRCGAVVGDPVVIDLLGRVIAPYPLSALTIDAALQATSTDTAQRMAELVEQTKENKTKLLEFLEACDWIKQILPGEANFVLLKVDDAEQLETWCINNGVRIRNFSTQPRLDGYIRVTIGDEAEMEKLTSTLTAYGETL